MNHGDTLNQLETRASLKKLNFSPDTIYYIVNVLTGIGFYMCGTDILATEKAISVNFILSLIKSTKTKITTLRTE